MDEITSRDDDTASPPRKPPANESFVFWLMKRRVGRIFTSVACEEEITSDEKATLLAKEIKSLVANFKNQTPYWSPEKIAEFDEIIPFVVISGIYEKIDELKIPDRAAHLPDVTQAALTAAASSNLPESPTDTAADQSTHAIFKTLFERFYLTFEMLDDLKRKSFSR